MTISTYFFKLQSMELYTNNKAVVRRNLAEVVNDNFYIIILTINS